MFSSSSQSDFCSIFSYDGEMSTDTFSLTQLTSVVESHFRGKCILKKLNQGGYHKVCEVFASVDDSPLEADILLDAVVRVASPAFPGDKMRSEIATLAYIAAHTSVPVPAIYAWNTEASNSVGAEWMIMQKVHGVAPTEIWEDGTLPIELKVKVVCQVAEHLAELFALRFDQAGSIYFTSEYLNRSSTSDTEASPLEFKIDPVISLPFYRSVDGVLDYPSTNLHSPGSLAFQGLHALRGPFPRVGDFIAHQLQAQLFKYEIFPDETLRDGDEESPANENENQMNDEENKQSTKTSTDLLPKLERAKAVMKKGIELCYVYPGDHCVWKGNVTTPDRPFTLVLGDFRLTNILIDEKTGKVNGYIDLEGAVTAPLWLAADVVDWVPDPMTDRANWYGGSRADQFLLWRTFHSTMDRCDPHGEWRNAYEGGRWFRRWTDHLGLGWRQWAEKPRRGCLEEFVDRRLTWANQEENEGVGMPD